MLNEECINHQKCPVTHCMNIIGGKWKTTIIYLISLGINRFGKMHRNCDGISKQMLTNQLRELEKNGIIKRKIYAEIPPRVEYSITAKGKTLFPIIESMKDWAIENMKNKSK